MQGKIAIGISYPKKILERIDSQREVVPLNRYLSRIIENMYTAIGNKSILTSTEKTIRIRSIVELEACNQANPGQHKRW
jgi:hypothetical protein